MDNTELHYVTYDPDAIWEKMMLAYVGAGGDILYPGDEKEMLLRGVLADIVQVLAGVDNALRMQTLRYAVGEYLDVFGENRGCERIAASRAMAAVSITASADTTLAEGTAVTADGQVFYRLTEAVTLSAGTPAAAFIRAVDAGSAGNGLTAGTQMQTAAANAVIMSILVTADAAGGNDAEEDEVYRERIRAYGLASVTTGPSQQYEAAARAVSSEILDAKAVKIAAGQVGVYLILKSETGAAAIKQAVAAALNAEFVRPLTDLLTVDLAEDVPYTLNMEYVCDGSSASIAALNAAAEEYRQWQDGVIGRAFDPYRLMAALYQAGATRVQFGEGSEFDGDDDIAYTEIGPAQRCAGTVTLTAAEE